MKDNMISQIKYNCRYFDGSKPCKHHKKSGVFCDKCGIFDRVKTRILIIKFAAVGDVLRTTSILPALKQKYDQSLIYWITSKSATPILNNNPHVDKVWADPEEYIPFLSTMIFDVVINLDADMKSSAIASAASAKHKKGFVLDKKGYIKPADNKAETWFMLGINDQLKKANEENYFEHIYKIIGLKDPIHKPRLYLTDSEKTFAKDFFAKHQLQRYKKLLGVNTGSGPRWPLKKWTFENHVLLMERIIKNNPEVGIVLFGGPEEKEFNSRLKTALDAKIIDTGTENSLREFFSLIDIVDVLLTPDSLGMHVGIALDKNVIVYTGPTSYTELDVFGKGEIIHSDIDCLVCYLNFCDKQNNCMDSLEVDQVYNSLQRFL
jgi:ADP-heptose:LPS heptosyltransferase